MKKVIRPENAFLAVGVAEALQKLIQSKKISELQYQRAFQIMLEMQPYRFIGYLSGNAKLVDEKGIEIGRLQPGDSFIE